MFPCFGDASKVCARVRQAAVIVDKVFTTFGMAINFQPGNTEALIIFRGIGSKSAGRCLWVDMKGHLFFSTTSGDKTLNCCQVYKPVGTRTTLSGSMMPEIRQRMAVMSSNLVKI